MSSLLPAPGSLGAWGVAVRPRTLVAGVIPVIVGTAVAFSYGSLSPVKAAGALVVAVALQTGTNLVNDLGDFSRGADRDGRLGPPRALQTGLLGSFAMKVAAGFAFGVAALVGFVLSIVSSAWLLIPGAAALAAGVAYTAGPKPIAYSGLAEIFVFAFFGVFAAAGTTYVQAGFAPLEAYLAGGACGCLAAAILEVNNLRDGQQDVMVGKQTLAVRLGPRRSRVLYGVLIAGAFLFAGSIAFLRPWVAMSFALLPMAASCVRGISGKTQGSALNKELEATARLEGMFGLLLALGLVL